MREVRVAKLGEEPEHEPDHRQRGAQERRCRPRRRAEARADQGSGDGVRETADRSLTQTRKERRLHAGHRHCPDGQLVHELRGHTEAHARAGAVHDAIHRAVDLLPSPALAVRDQDANARADGEQLAEGHQRGEQTGRQADRGWQAHEQQRCHEAAEREEQEHRPQRLLLVRVDQAHDEQVAEGQDHRSHERGQHGHTLSSMGILADPNSPHQRQDERPAEGVSGARRRTAAGADTAGCAAEPPP